MTETAGRKVTFEDVAGADAAKGRPSGNRRASPKRSAKIPAPRRADSPGGVPPLVPPGTGKTLTRARDCLAKLACPFLPISGSDFVEMFVGVGASRIRDMFEQAKKNAPCIIFC